MFKVSGIFIYPIKSLRGISVQETALSRTGFEWDRRWMLVDENNRFLSQRECNRLALFSVQMEANIITIYNRLKSSISFSFHIRGHSGIKKKVTIWDDECDAMVVSSDADAWFSDLLERKVQLVYMPDTTHRMIDPNYTVTSSDTTSFSDGFPLLMIGEASLSELNKRLHTSIGMDRFRPNLVFSGGLPHDEDRMLHFSVNRLKFHGVKPCARCIVTTIDPETGKGGKEPLKTLSLYRSYANNIYFGQNVIGPSEGQIKIGDRLEDIRFTESNDFVS
jgi:uncharacterized protein